MMRRRKGITGLEAAIVLIAFVIIAAAFAYMYINMGSAATSQAKTSIAESLRTTRSPLATDGSIIVRTDANRDIQFIIIPLRTMGEEKVPLWPNETTVTLVFQDGGGSYANVYTDFNRTYDVTQKDFDTIITEALGSVIGTPSTQPNAILVAENTNGDYNLDSSEKGYLLIDVGPNLLSPRTSVTIEIRIEGSSPLTISFIVPPDLPADTYTIIHA